MLEDTFVELKCHFCGGDTNAEHLCYGCGAYLCENCEDTEDDPWGEHEPSAHPAAVAIDRRLVPLDPDFQSENQRCP